MFNINNDIPNTNAPSDGADYGTFRNDVTEGDNQGSPLSAMWPNDLYYALYAVMKEVGVQPNGQRENTNNSDFLKAIKLLIKQIISETQGNTITPLYNQIHASVSLKTPISDADIVIDGPLVHIKMNGQTIPSTNTVVFDLLDKLSSLHKSYWLTSDSTTSKVMKNYTGLFSRASGGNASSVGAVVQDSIKKHDHQSNVLVQNDSDGQSIRSVKYEEVTTDSKKVSIDNEMKDNVKSPRSSSEGSKETAPTHFAQKAWYLTLVDFDSF
ncbi:hypothetical protein [Vibrio parahaemolyticus]|uniref:hypothetical protein n=1 Tax=Vibrio parahaemolyticus TaxID=670 RepID=UPI00389160D5